MSSFLGTVWSKLIGMVASLIVAGGFVATPVTPMKIDLPATPSAVATTSASVSTQENVSLASLPKKIAISWIPLKWVALKTTSANTEGWNIFSNDKYHFSFKYPKEWGIERNSEFTNPDTHFTSLHVTLGNSAQRFDIEVQKRISVLDITPEAMHALGATRTYFPYREIAHSTSVQSNCGISSQCTSINFQRGEAFFNIDVGEVATSTLDTIFDSFSVALVSIATSTNTDTVPVTAPDGRTLYYKGITKEQALELFQQCQVIGGIEAFAGTFITLKDGTQAKLVDGGSMGDLMKAAVSVKEKCGFSPGIGIE